MTARESCGTRRPRCGKPVRRLERAGRAVLEDPSCGRPEGHRGRCRSAAAVARYARADIARQAVLTGPCECGCGQLVTAGHRYRHGHNPKTSAPGRRVA